MLYPDPGQVASVDADMETKAITLSVIYPMGTLARCLESGVLCSIKEHRRKKWRHLAQMGFATFGIQLILACQNLTQVGNLLGISWNGIQAIQRRGVERGLLRRKREKISHLGIDERPSLSRHRYVDSLS